MTFTVMLLGPVVTSVTVDPESATTVAPLGCHVAPSTRYALATPSASVVSEFANRKPVTIPSGGEPGTGPRGFTRTLGAAAGAGCWPACTGPLSGTAVQAASARAATTERPATTALVRRPGRSGMRAARARSATSAAQRQDASGVMGRGLRLGRASFSRGRLIMGCVRRLNRNRRAGDNRACLSRQRQHELR